MLTKPKLTLGLVSRPRLTPACRNLTASQIVIGLGVFMWAVSTVVKAVGIV